MCRMAGFFRLGMNSLLRAIDRCSYWSGKAFAWLIVALTLVVSVEVFKRYILNAPTAWIFDFNSMLYGTLFMMCGAYALALGAHVRADFIYIYLRPRAQATLLSPLRNRSGRTNHLPARVRWEDGRLIARPVRTQGSGDLVAHARANALLVMEPDRLEAAAGETVEALLLDSFLEDDGAPL